MWIYILKTLLLYFISHKFVHQTYFNSTTIILTLSFIIKKYKNIGYFIFRQILLSPNYSKIISLFFFVTYQDVNYVVCKWSLWSFYPILIWYILYQVNVIFSEIKNVCQAVLVKIYTFSLYTCINMMLKLM